MKIKVTKEVAAHIKKMNAELATYQKLSSNQRAVIAHLNKELEAVTKIASDAGEVIEDMQEKLAKKAGEVVEAAVKDAMDPSSSVSSDTKDKIIEAISKVDPDIAQDVTEEFTKAEVTEEDMDAEKLSSILIPAIQKIGRSVKRSSFTGGTTRARANDKVASGKTFQDRIAEELRQIGGM